MAPRKIMLIRHAEKPDEERGLLGVEETGAPNPHQLSVRGWQRAGALVQVFASPSENSGGDIERPTAIIACSPSNGSNSMRSLSTVKPLAAFLGVAVNEDIGCGDSSALIAFLKESVDDVVLVCWRHEALTDIVRGLAGNLENVPTKWPGKRFDLVWIMEQNDTNWTFKQTAQLLLPGDGPAAVIMPLAATDES